jgi:hypothetical protein
MRPFPTSIGIQCWRTLAQTRLLERRPAPVFFVSSRALLARIVQEALRDSFPDRVPAVEADRVDGLDFHGSLAPPAGDAQDVALNLRKPAVPHVDAVRLRSSLWQNSDAAAIARAMGPPSLEHGNPL